MMRIARRCLRAISRRRNSRTNRRHIKRVRDCVGDDTEGSDRRKQLHQYREQHNWNKYFQPPSHDVPQRIENGTTGLAACRDSGHARRRQDDVGLRKVSPSTAGRRTARPATSPARFQQWRMACGDALTGRRVSESATHRSVGSRSSKSRRAFQDAGPGIPDRHDGVPANRLELNCQATVERTARTRHVIAVGRRRTHH